MGRLLAAAFTLTLCAMLISCAAGPGFDEQMDKQFALVAATGCFRQMKGRWPYNLEELAAFHCPNQSVAPFSEKRGPTTVDPKFFKWVDFVPSPDGGVFIRWQSVYARDNTVHWQLPAPTTQPAAPHSGGE